jgi:hypothetical protein
VLARWILDPLASDDVPAVAKAQAVAVWFMLNVHASKEGIIEPIELAVAEANAKRLVS